MFVYFMQQADTGPVKIGCAKDPQARLNLLQTHNPYPVRLRAVCRGSLRVERLLHRHFEASRLRTAKGRGEWFEPTPELVTFMDKLPSWETVRKGGDCPSIVSRQDAVQKLRRVGYSLQEIGDHFGFTRQRAHQLSLGTQFDRRSFQGSAQDKPDLPPITDYIAAHPEEFASTVEITLTEEEL